MLPPGLLEPGNVADDSDVAWTVADLGLNLGGPEDVGGGNQVDLADPFVDELLADLGPEGVVGQADGDAAGAGALSPLESMWNSRVRHVGDRVGKAEKDSMAHPTHPYDGRFD